jgi:Kdo2-lipid IVA lauroyltransferase/acyltransferase
MKKDFKFYLGLYSLKFGSVLVRSKNLAAGEKRVTYLAKFGFMLDRKHRERTFSNVRFIFPHLNEQEVQAFVKKNVEHFGALGADFLRTPIRSREEVFETTEIVGKEHLDRLLEEKKGIILVSAHLGNWERITQWIPMMGIKLSGVARNANDAEITEIATGIRSGNGMEVLSRGNAAREMLKRLKAGEMVGLMPDQNADDAYLPFFGHPAGTVLGPAVIHKKTKSPILPGCCLRTGPGQYRIYFLEPMVAEESETAEEFMTRINGAIEQMIRLAPEQYLWMHDRWKNARRKGLIPE